jgi:hypothetical protein
LEALHAGRPIDVPFNSLPNWAKSAASSRKSSLGLVDIYPVRAIVAADDSINFSDADAMRLWLQENDL